MPHQDEARGFYGEIWVKTRGGWRTSKTINIRKRSMEEEQQNNGRSPDDAGRNESQNFKGFLWNMKAPYIVLPGCPTRGPSFYFVSKRGSKQNGNYSTVGGALQALDFREAARDSRKFLYVCKLLEIMIQSDHVAPEGGMARKQISLALHEVVHTALDTELNVHIARNLVNLSKEQLFRERQKFLSLRQRNEKGEEELTDLQGKLKRFKIKKLRKGISKSSMHISELPDECFRMIVACFADHRDICRLAKVSRHFREICNEQNVWRRLCHFHLAKKQLEKVKFEVSLVWKDFYKKMIRQSTMRDSFADILQLCSHCHCLFWKRASHPCTYDVNSTEHQMPVFIPITPEGFIHLFEA